VIDYGALADKLKVSGDAVKQANKGRARHGIAPAAFYESVKTQIEVEVEKANEELRKRGLPIIERIFMPGFLGKLSLTFGTALLCSVELQESKGRVRAVIFGPPNRDEIARKDFPLNPEVVDLKGPPMGEVETATVGYSPQMIAAEIVSALLMGDFA
jgi:hypothetical protein